MKKLSIGDVTIISIIERDGPWRIITSAKHSTVWDGDDTLFASALSTNILNGASSRVTAGCPNRQWRRTPSS